jgi:RimJ/RimL family protein N-acetyltransferase
MAVSNRDRASIQLTPTDNDRPSSVMVTERFHVSSRRSTVTAVIPQNIYEKIQMLAWLTGHIETNFDAEYTYPIGFAYKDDLIAVFAFHDYRPPDIHMSVAATSPRWATRANIKALARYCFDFLKCKRVTAVTNKSNKTARSMLERIGFRLEGVMRQHRPNGEDGMIYGILPEDIKIIKNGRIK